MRKSPLQRPLHCLPLPPGGFGLGNESTTFCCLLVGSAFVACVVIADVAVEIAVIVDLGFVADIYHAIPIKVGCVVVGFVVQLVVAPHDQHVQRRHGLADEQRGLRKRIAIGPGHRQADGHAE